MGILCLKFFNINEEIFFFLKRNLEKNDLNFIEFIKDPYKNFKHLKKKA
jgi:hypothetical protein